MCEQCSIDIRMIWHIKENKYSENDVIMYYGYKSKSKEENVNYLTIILRHLLSIWEK